MSTRAFTLAASVVTLLVAGALSLAASGSPDGLTFVSQLHGFAGTEDTGSLLHDGPLAGYAVRGLGADQLSGALAGVIGCVTCFALMRLVVRRRGTTAARR